MPTESRPAATGSGFGSYLAGRHAERERDFTSAAQFMVDALEHDPANLDLLYRTHMLLLGDGRFDEAAVLANRIVRAGVNSPFASLTVAVAQVRAGDFAGAASRLEGLPLTGANRVVLPLMRAWIAAGQNQSSLALETLKALNEIDGFKALYEYHAALISDFVGRPDSAEKHFRQALAIEGGPSVRLVESAGNFLERHGKLAEARALYTRHSADLPESVLLAATLARLDRGGGPPPPTVPTAAAGLAEGLFNVAGALRQESGGQLALIYGRLALALVPEKPAGLVLVADILDGAGRHAESSALFARVPPDSPLAWSARLRIAENLEVMGQSDAAIEALERMSTERPERAEALVTLGQLLRAKQRFPEAAQAYDRAIARLPEIEARHWPLFYARGIAYERSQQWAKAEADFVRALELQPEQPDVMNYLAYSWVERGVNLDRALRMLERAVALRPNSGHIVDSLGWALVRLGRYGDAVPLLERAAEIMPEDPVILDHLGDAYWRVGRLAEARFQWERALRNKPEPGQRVELERKLERGLAANTRSGS